MSRSKCKKLIVVYRIVRSHRSPHPRAAQQQRFHHRVRECLINRKVYESCNCNVVFDGAKVRHIIWEKVVMPRGHKKTTHRTRWRRCARQCGCSNGQCWKKVRRSTGLGEENEWAWVKKTGAWVRRTVGQWFSSSSKSIPT